MGGYLSTRAFVALPFVVLLAGCGLEEEFYAGTTKGFAICKKNAEAQGSVSPTTIRVMCTKKHERSLDGVEIAGSARFTGVNEFEKGLRFVGNFVNKESDVIVTGISVSIMPNDGEQVTREVNGTWIEPGRSGSFSFTDLPYPQDVLIKKESYTWWVDEVKGIKVRF